MLRTFVGIALLLAPPQDEEAVAPEPEAVEAAPADLDVGEAERQDAEQERQTAEQERQKAEQERQKAEQERLKAEQERQRPEQERQKAAEEKCEEKAAKKKFKAQEEEEWRKKCVQVQLEEHPGPRAAVDPLQSALATVPDVPVLDVLSASVSVAPDDTFVKFTIAPFALVNWLERGNKRKPGASVANELRLSTSGDTGKGTFGLGGSWGYSSMSHNLWVDEIGKKCEAIRKDLESKTNELRGFVNDNGGHLEESATSGEVLAAWKRLKPFNANALNQTEKDEGDALQEALQQAINNHNDAKNKCVGTALYRARMDMAYNHGIGFQIAGDATLFALVDGPRVEDPPCSATVTTNCVQPGDEQTFSPVAPNRLQSVKGTVALTYFPTVSLGMWATGSYTRSRAKSADADLDEQVAVGGTLAGLVPFPKSGEANEDGYIRGLVFGLAYQRRWCTNREGTGPCVPTLLFYGDDTKKSAKMKQMDTITPYFDVRISSKLQTRLSLPIDIIQLKEDLMGTEPGRLVYQVIPSITVGVASWGFK